MSPISRREFLKLCAGSAAAITLSEALFPFLKEAAAAPDKPAVIWLAGAACTGCSVSLLNSVKPDVKEVLLELISLKYHNTVMGASGDQAMETIFKTAEEQNGKFILVVEGAVPLKDGGLYCMVGERNGEPITFANLVKEVGSKAFAVLNFGTCSAYGGIPAASPNPTGCVPVSEILSGKPIINVPGCPPHPDWMVGTIAHVLFYNEIPELDKHGRPVMFFGGIIHDNCPRRQYFDNGIFAENFSDPGCLLELGCKGPIAHCDSTTRLWNGGVNWCIKAGAPCIGCTEPGFPLGPTYERLPEIPLGPRTGVSADTAGIALGALTVAGIAAHLVGNVATGRIPGKHEKKEGDH